MDATTAEVIHRIPFRARSEASVNAASPVKIGQGDNAGLFLTACYSTGGLALSGVEKGQKLCGKMTRPFQAILPHPFTTRATYMVFMEGRKKGLNCVVLRPKPALSNGPRTVWDVAG